MTRPDLLREAGRGPLGSAGTSSSPDNQRLAKRTPGPLGVNDAVGRTAGRVTFRDFTAAQQEVMRAAIKLALRSIGPAKAELTSAKTRSSPNVARYFKIAGTTDADKKNLDAAIANYNTIAGALLGHENLVFDAEKTGPYFVGDVRAYVWSTDRPGPGEEGVVKIVTPKFAPRSIEDKARTVIHEIAHRYAGAEGDVYLDEGVGKMTTEEAIDNADTYAHFAIPRPRPGSIKVKFK